MQAYHPLTEGIAAGATRPRNDILPLCALGALGGKPNLTLTPNPAPVTRERGA